MKNELVVSLTFDDIGTSGWTLMSKYCKPLKHTFYVNTCGSCWKNSSVNMLNSDEIETIKLLVKNKHEIGYHTHNHMNIRQSSNQKVQCDFEKWKSIIMNLGCKQKLFTFAYPYGSFRNSKFIRDSFVASRLFDNEGINKWNNINLQKLHTYNIYSTTKADDIIEYIKSNIQRGGWLIFAGHSIGKEGWEPIPIKEYKKLVEYLVKQKISVKTVAEVVHLRV